LNNDLACTGVNGALNDNRAAHSKNNRVGPISGLTIIHGGILGRRPYSLPQAASAVVIIHIINQGIYRNDISSLDSGCAGKGYDEREDEKDK
jgi:hypothetical protein